MTATTTSPTVHRCNWPGCSRLCTSPLCALHREVAPRPQLETERGASGDLARREPIPRGVPVR
jgi:hypothetical protein